MSTMLEAYDMPMLEYPPDLDIQMHPSSSDQWIPEESHMEEDTPAVQMKTENYSSPKPDDHLHMKADVYAQEKSEITIEVDMEPFPEHQNTFSEPQNNEYEMQEDEPVLQESLTEAPDVEVYDVSLAQSPFMIPSLDVPHSISSSFSGHFNHLEPPHHPISASPIVTHSPDSPLAEPHNLDITLSDHTAAGEVQSESNEVHEVLPEMHHDVSNVSPEVPEVHDVPPEVHEHHDFQPEAHEHHDFRQENHEIRYDLPQTQLEEHIQSELPESLNVPENEPIAEEPLLESQPHVLEETLGIQTHLSESSESSKNHSETDAERAGALHPESEVDVYEKETSNTVIQPETGEQSSPRISANDPHEISEGVYIDPPPPVLVSVASEDQFDFALFNESPDWSPSHSSGAVFLRNLPTLYYEPLSAVFEALREEEYVQSMFHLAESELFLDAVDLQLTISEDNVYAREVTLHDLNVLHDISGINGLLRMRLYPSAPRFIIRYQHLQEHVSRLNMEQPTAEASSAGDQGDIQNNQHPEIRQEQIDEDHYPVDRSNDSEETSKGVEHLSNIPEDREGGTTSTDTSHIIPSPGQCPEPSSSQVLPDHDEVEHHNQDGNDEGEITPQPVDVHNPESYLPPLPADYEEENEEGGTDVTNEEHSLAQEEITQPHSDAGLLEHPQESEVEHVIAESTDENVIAELTSSEATTITEHALPVEEEEAHQIHEGYDYVEENAEIGYEDIYTGQSSVKNTYADGEEEESGDTEARYGDEEYAEDAVNPEEEDTTSSHTTGDDLEYAQEEADPAPETESFETPVEDLEYGHLSEPHYVGDSSADLGSETGQPVTYGDPGVDPDSGQDVNEVENETEASAELYNYENLEDGTEFESGHAWESSIDHTGQETYDWEDDFGEENNHDTHWDNQNEKLATNSAHSSVTLSSKTSKRSFDELEVEDEFEDEAGHWSNPSSPGPKRSRIQ